MSSFFIGEWSTLWFKTTLSGGQSWLCLFLFFLDHAWHDCPGIFRSWSWTLLSQNNNLARLNLGKSLHPAKSPPYFPSFSFSFVTLILLFHGYQFSWRKGLLNWWLTCILNFKSLGPGQWVQGFDNLMCSISLNSISLSKETVVLVISN